MKKILNNKGMGLPAVLGIIIFVVTSTAILLSFSYSQYLLIEANRQNNEEYINIKQEIEAACNILIRDEDFSASYLQDLSDYLDINISEYDTDILLITKTTDYDQEVRSYLNHSSSSNLISMGDELFSNDGLESSFELDPFLTPISVLSSYLSVFMDNKSPSLDYDETFDSFKDLLKYIDTISKNKTTYIEVKAKDIENQNNPTVYGNWYVDGNLEIDDNKNLTIQDGYVLFVDGNLEMGTASTISGNIVVDGDVNIVSKKKTSYIQGTIYTSGTITTDGNIVLGTSNRPTFIFSEENIIFKKTLSGYGYFLVNKFQVGKKSNVNIYGGVYANTIKNLESDEITVNNSLDEDDLYNFGVPTTVSYNTGDETGPTYIYTKPK